MRTKPLDRMPFRTHPLVSRLWVLMRDWRRETGESIIAIAERSGVARETIYHWETRHNPSVDTFDAVLRTIGHRLAIEPVREGLITVEFPAIKEVPR